MSNEELSKLFEELLLSRQISAPGLFSEAQALSESSFGPFRQRLSSLSGALKSQASGLMSSMSPASDGGASTSAPTGSAGLLSKLPKFGLPSSSSGDSADESNSSSGLLSSPLGQLLNAPNGAAPQGAAEPDAAPSGKQAP